MKKSSKIVHHLKHPVKLRIHLAAPFCFGSKLSSFALETMQMILCKLNCEGATIYIYIDFMHLPFRKHLNFASSRFTP